MYFILTLFLISLLSIGFMIGRKLLALQAGNVLPPGEEFFDEKYFEELKHNTLKNIKKYGYLTLVEIIRMYVKFINLLRTKYYLMAQKLDNWLEKRQYDENGEPRQVNKFLKMVTDYKHRIRKIKQKVKEEEES